MRKITLIVIHSSAVVPRQQSMANEIERGQNTEYHFMVHRSGEIEAGRRMEEVASHVQNHNKHSIAICYEGGLNSEDCPADPRNPKQVKALRELVEQMHAYFPKALIVGHHDLDPRMDCPYFDTVKEFADLQP